MPIRPENKARYPADWAAIRAAILERAGHKCEGCGVINHALGYRDAGGAWHDAGLAFADGFTLHEGKPYRVQHGGRWYPLVLIVLTVAHLDHTPEHCDPANLRAWCQACHNRYDAAHRRETRAATRAAKMNGAQLALPLP